MHDGTIGVGVVIGRHLEKNICMVDVPILA